MPRGYYLGQGLIPLGYSSSDDDEGPCVLPNGKTVCGPHGLELCYRCESDYSILNEDIDDEDEDEDENEEVVDYAPDDDFPPMQIQMLKGTGRVFPTRFQPPAGAACEPRELFSSTRPWGRLQRCILPTDASVLLLMTDGACVGNGQPNPKAGWAFFQGLNQQGEPLLVSGRLEKKGPWGDDGLQTSNRAELRAVIAALQFRYWPGESFKKIVIATDSEYVVNGSTEWARKWFNNGWKTKNNRGQLSNPVKNKDLWEALLGKCEDFYQDGTTVEFWRIPREFNILVDKAAKDAAAGEEAPDEWTKQMGMAF